MKKIEITFDFQRARNAVAAFGEVATILGCMAFQKAAGYRYIIVEPGEGDKVRLRTPGSGITWRFHGTREDLEREVTRGEIEPQVAAKAIRFLENRSLV